MPESVRKAIFAAVVVLAITAAIGNLGHVFDFAHDQDHGGQTKEQAAVASLLPDILLLLSVVKLRYDRRSVWAWSGAARGR